MKTIKRCNELYELWTGLYMLDAWEKGLWSKLTTNTTSSLYILYLTCILFFQTPLSWHFSLLQAIMSSSH